MKVSLLSVCISVHLWLNPAYGAQLALSIVRQGTGDSSFTTLPGATVDYEIRGLLDSSTDNLGLAFWSVDLAFGGSASAANHVAGADPATSPMNQFVKNTGFTNPGGYGGTLVGTSVVQIGGGQNTIQNSATHAPYPVGTPVATGVAHTSYVVLATSSYPIPANAPAGSQYTITLTKPLASVINNGQSGPSYTTRAIAVTLSPATLSVSTPPNATITAAVSRTANPTPSSGYCEQLLLPGVKSEMHTSGITEVRVTFDVAPGDPPGTDSDVIIEEKVCPAPGSYAGYAGASTVTGGGTGSTWVLTFSPPLENARTYKINLGSLISAVAGQYVEVRGLVGDVNGNGTVDAIDRSAIIVVMANSGFSCKTDLNSDGVTDATDRSIAVAAWNGTGTDCAP